MTVRSSIGPRFPIAILSCSRPDQNPYLSRHTTYCRLLHIPVSYSICPSSIAFGLYSWSAISLKTPRLRFLSRSLFHHEYTHTTMKIFASTHEFDYSWEEVSTANWRKYCPWNDKSTHVIAVDTLERHVDPETGIVRPSLLGAFVKPQLTFS